MADLAEMFQKDKDINMANVRGVEKILMDMTGGRKEEDCEVFLYHELPVRKQTQILRRLRSDLGLGEKDMQQIKLQLFGSSSRKVVTHIQLESGKFDGNYALFAAESDDKHFHLLLAQYTLSLRGASPKDPRFKRLEVKHRNKMDDYLRYKAVTAFEEKLETFEVACITEGQKGEGEVCVMGGPGESSSEEEDDYCAV